MHGGMSTENSPNWKARIWDVSPAALGTLTAPAVTNDSSWCASGALIGPIELPPGQPCGMPTLRHAVVAGPESSYASFV
jgi:hypothetical protein